MGINKYKSLPLISLFSALSLAVIVSPVFAAPQQGFTEMTVTGKTTIDLSYDVDDTKGVMNYSGAKYFKTCDAYTEAATGKTHTCNVSDFKKAQEFRITDQAGSIQNPVNMTSKNNKLGVKNFILSTEEGVHNVCIQNRDNADHTPGTGNISGILCREIFYDKTGPRIDKIVINNANHWINKGDIPVIIEVYDNRAGIDKITYVDGYGNNAVIDLTEPGNKMTCERNTHPSLGDGSYKCRIEATLHTNSDRWYGDLGFKIYDKVGNTTAATECPGSWVDVNGKGSCRIYYDKQKPNVDAVVNNSGNGGINNNTGHVEYHVKDDPHDIWKSPSGIEQIIIQNADGTGDKEWILDERDNPDPSKTADGVIKDYLFNKCPASAKITVIDKAGNVTVVITPPMACNMLGFHEFRVLDVINPKVYNIRNPFVIRPWNFTPNPIISAATGGFLGPNMPTYDSPYGILPEGLAGANVTFDTAYTWDGDPNGEISGFYTVRVYNEVENYEESWTTQLTQSNFEKAETIQTPNGQTVVYRLKPETFAIPKDAPATDTNRNSYTYVSINMNLTIHTREGLIDKYQTRVFPKDKDGRQFGHIVVVNGSIDDYLWFGSIN